MASYPSYIPAKQLDFAAWILNFSTLLTATPTDYGLTAADAVAVDAVNTTFQDALTIALDPDTRTTPTVEAKNVAMASAKATVRPYAVAVSRNPAVTNELKAGIGVTVRSGTQTPIPAPTDQPALAIESATPLNSVLAYTFPGFTGKSKPFGAIGVQVFQSVGDLPATDPNQTNYVQTFTKSPFRMSYTAEQQGKTASIYARLVTRGGPGGEQQVGPWSAQLSIIVM